MNNIYIGIGLYLIILFSIVFYVQRKEKKEDFLIAGRDRKWWNIMFSKFAGSVGMGWFLSYTAYSYEYGFGVFTIVLGFILGYALFAFWVVPKIYSIARKNTFYTQGDLVEYNTKCNRSKKITDIYSSIVQFVWLLVSVIGGAKIIENMLLISYELSALIILVVVLGYILLGGYKVVLVTDIFQGIIIIALLSIISFSIINGSNITEVITEETSRLSTASIIGFFLYGILSILALSDRYQLCYSAKNEKQIKKGMFLTFIPILITASLLLFIGLFMHMQNPNLDSSLVFLEAIKNHLPETLLSVGIVLFFAGLMSSADTYIYAISSHLSFLGKKKKSIRNIKKVAILLAIFTYIIAFFFRDIIGVTVFGAGLSLIMSIPMIYIIKGGKDSHRFIYSVVLGITGLFLGIIFLGLEPSIALTVLIGGLIGLLFRKRKTL